MSRTRPRDGQENQRGGFRRGAGRKRGVSSWEAERVRVRILKTHHEALRKLRVSGGFVSDTDFFAHLLDVEEVRQRSLESQ